MKYIKIHGARTHNLKNISLDIPRDKLVVITGLSGSGKSSLAFDTLYAEGQRRYVESLSSYARQFLSMMEKPDVDHIEGLSPAISIEQKSTSHNPRSTVGTVTEIADYLRLLFARVGEPRCPTHDLSLSAQTVSQMVDGVCQIEEGQKIMILAPVVIDRKGEHLQAIDALRREGFIRARVDGLVLDLDEPIRLDGKKKHTIEAVVDRIKIADDQKNRLAESFETALRVGEGLVYVVSLDDEKAPPMVFSSKYACPHCGYGLPSLEPRMFSFNNPSGACESCDGLGVKQFFDAKKIIRNDFSIAEGAIRGWDKLNGYYFQMLDSLSKHYDFSMTETFETLPEKIKDIILHGSGNEEIDFVFMNDRGSVRKSVQPFEGIIANYERRFRDTDSSFIREELTKFLTKSDCPDCGGTRLKESVRHVMIDNKNLSAISRMSVENAYQYYETLKLPGHRGEIAEKILKEVVERLRFLNDVGLNYLTLDRGADTLSGGEAQRIRLASQIGSGLVGVMYVLDEPSIGLHQRDNARLLATLVRLRELGNTVVVVEHDEEAIRAADYIIDIGPGAGVHGGEVVASGTAEMIEAAERSLTGQYLSGKKEIKVPDERRLADDEVLKIYGASGNNLKNVTLTIPVGLFTCVTGVSGSGKSTLINETLHPVAATILNGATTLQSQPHDAIEGLDYFDKVIDIDQSPIGRTPRSNPATYTGLFTVIRELFAAVPESRARGYNPGRFSFNVRGGRCEACQGDGMIKVEMHFLPDMYVPCDDCQGKRYNRETLEITYKGKTIHEILDMTVEESLSYFENVPTLFKKLQTLMDVGLSYLKLGQSAVTLSGGEAQRIKLSKELSKRDTGKTLYILDEPTTGLHFHDVSLLLDVLHRLVDHGNTVVVIEHNLDVIKTADWIIDLGPEGGSGGGEIIVAGVPEDIIDHPKSHTAKFLRPYLAV